MDEVLDKGRVLVKETQKGRGGPLLGEGAVQDVDTRWQPYPRES